MKCTSKMSNIIRSFGVLALLLVAITISPLLSPVTATPTLQTICGGDLYQPSGIDVDSQGNIFFNEDGICEGKTVKKIEAGVT